MTNGLWYRAASVLSLLLAPVSVLAAGLEGAGGGGGVMGWVEDNRGAPVAGAVISVFGKGVGGSGLVTMSDSAGRFFLPSLPAGSYTVRAGGVGHLPAPARKITVLPNRDSTFTVSLTPIGEDAAAAKEDGRHEETPGPRELTWLLRHKRRSVLETRDAGEAVEDGANTQPGAPRLLASFHPDLVGSVELVANPTELGSDAGAADETAALSILRLRGRIAESGHWSLGGLVSESENAIWRMAAEFVLTPEDGHEVQVGTGYGARWRRTLIPGEQDGRLDDRSVGALFVQDRWALDDRLTATLGGRFTHIGFLADSNHLDPLLALEFRHDDQTSLRGSVCHRTLVPGGDLLTLSTLATAPAVAYAAMELGLRPERSVRVDVAVDQNLGATRLTAHTFYEGVDDQLDNRFAPDGGRALRISNAGRVTARGMGLAVERRFGDSFSGSMSYTFGHSWRPGFTPPAEALARPWRQEGDFHDLVARVETVLEGTDTRLVAYYRLSHLVPVREAPAALTTRASRFDVQLSQGLPFLASLTRADWDLLLAVRNLYYEPTEGALLDEMTVSNPPKRVLGGIAVRF